VVALLVWTEQAQSAPCGRADVDATFPPDGARAVPATAVLSAHYGAPADYRDEGVKLTDQSGAEVSVSAAFSPADSLLSATPDMSLPEGNYTVEWPSLRGVSGAGAGLGKQVRFSVNAASDAAAPQFEGLIGITWDLSRDRDPCTDRDHDRFVFRLELGSASDDAGTDLLALHVFQTRDPLAAEGSGPSEVALTAWPSDGTVEVRRPTSKAGETCFAALVQDLAGHVSGGGQREVCVETQKPPFFDGCNLARFGPKPKSGGAVWLAALSLLLRGRSAKRKRARAA
jgi:methionine-rich copper-binding protein CopC